MYSAILIHCPMMGVEFLQKRSPDKYQRLVIINGIHHVKYSSIMLHILPVLTLIMTSEALIDLYSSFFLAAFSDYEQMSHSLTQGTVKGLLIDSYVAARRPVLFGTSKARVNKIIKDAYSYGFVVPNGKEMTSAAITCFRSYVEQQKQSISTDVERNTLTLEVRVFLAFTQ